MSVLINGMEMPKNCAYCPLSEYRNTSLGQILDCKRIGTVGAAVRGTHDVLNHRHPNCPLVEIPTPHGVLKDTTAFDERIRDRYCKKCERRFGIKNGKRKEVYEIGDVPCRACDIGDMLDWLDDALTVIEAEGREE